MSQKKRANTVVTWVPDNIVAFCQQCHRQFTVTRRRHHCRRCGQIFCNPCSSNKTTLEGFVSKHDGEDLENGQHRICDNCAFATGVLSTKPKKQSPPQDDSYTKMRMKQKQRYEDWVQTISNLENNAIGTVNECPLTPESLSVLSAPKDAVPSLQQALSNSTSQSSSSNSTNIAANPLSSSSSSNTNTSSEKIHNLNTSFHSAATPPSGKAPCARKHHQIVSHGEDLILYGGITDDGTILDDVWRYQKHAHCWDQIQTGSRTSPGKRYGHRTCYLTCALFLYGGYSSVTTKKPCKDLWVLPLGPVGSHSIKSSWQVVVLSENSSQPPARAFHSLTPIGDEKTVILYGGENTNTDLWVGTIAFRQSTTPGGTPFRVVTWRKWASSGSIPPSLFGHQAVFTPFPFLSLVLFHGVQNSEKDSGSTRSLSSSPSSTYSVEGKTINSKIYRLDLISRHWGTITPPNNGKQPQGRHGHICCLLGGRFFALCGGVNAKGDPLNNMWILHIESSQWFKFQDFQGLQLVPRCFMAGIPFGRNSFILSGGQVGAASQPKSSSSDLVLVKFKELSEHSIV